MSLTPAIWQRYGLWFALAAFVATRAIIWIVACHAPQDRSSARGIEWWSPIPTSRWDAGHYNYILNAGYPLVDGHLPEPPRSDTVAFFPAYPFIARPLAHWMNSELALIVVTHAAALLAVVFLYLWARRRYDGRIAFWCVVLLCVYPPAMFFSTGYADGMLIFCVALALWLLEHQRLWAAALVSAVATATRPTGLCLAAIVVLWFILYAPRPQWPRHKAGSVADPTRPHDTILTQPPGSDPGGWANWLSRLAVIGFLSIAGLIAFQLHLWHHYGRPDAFMAVQKSWEVQREPSQKFLKLITLSPVLQPAIKPFKYTIRGLFELAGARPEEARDQFRKLLDPMSWNPLFNVTVVALGIVGLLRPGRIPRVLFLLPILAFLEAYAPDPYRGGRLVGIARYQLIALPVFLLVANALARPRRAAIRYTLCLAMLALQCIYIAQFVNWGTAG